MASLAVCSIGVLPRQCSGVARAATPSVTVRRGVRCQAASENGAHCAQYNLDTLNTKIQVFRDESKGIVCYRTPAGEITCEGIDEGPHFQPKAENQKGLLLSQLLLASKGVEEPLVNGAGI